MALPDIVIGSRLDAKGFKQAETASAKLTKSVKKLAGAFGLAFSTKAIVNFSKASVKAFADDDAAITVLRQNLKNLGLAYQSVNAENFIGKLEQQTGILDDELRPAYAKLSKVTLSTTKTQELMALAVDVARANGLAFSDVVNTLSQAYMGNYKGLKQLNTGLTAAELATKDFAEIQAILINQSKGANKAYIDTFAGSIDKLAVASANAKEVIGEGLVDLFADMAGNGDIDQATANVNLFATAVSDLLKDADKLTLLDYLGVFLTGSITQESFDKLDKRPSARRFFTGGSGVSTELLAARKAAAAAAAKIKADKLAAANKIKADKLAAANKAKLDKAAAVFDLSKIQIAAALKGKISEEEKIRLLLMQAIEEGNAEKAEVLQKKLEKIQELNAKIAADLLAIGEATDPFANWVLSLDAAAAILGKMPALLNATGSLTGRGKVTLPTGDGLPGGSGSIFTDDMTAADIADTATAAADMAAEAVLALADSVIASEAIVLAIAESADALYNVGDVLTNAPAATGSSSMFNPYGQTPGSSAGAGIPYPSTNVYVTVEGSILSENDAVTAITNAVIQSQKNGNSIVPRGAVLD
jgi:hypothetical protein